MSLSLKAGNPMPWPNLNSIADSLSAPKTEPYPFGLCQQFVDQVSHCFRSGNGHGHAVFI